MIKTRKEIAEEAINKYLNEPIKNITQAYYDEFVKENAKSSAQVGIKTIVIRREIGRCCDWCHSLVGEYEYGEQPADFLEDTITAMHSVVPEFEKQIHRCLEQKRIRNRKVCKNREIKATRKRRYNF